MTHFADTPTSPATPARTGIRSSSVPSILLGLGALAFPRGGRMAAPVADDERAR